MKMRTWIFRMPARFSARLGRVGHALAEAAIVMPVLLLMVVGIIEMASAWRTYQVVTNAAREGARVALLPTADETQVRERVQASVEAGGLNWDDVDFSAECLTAGGAFIEAVCGPSATGTEARIRVSFDYTFRLLQPVAALACRGACTTNFGTITIGSSSTMRNE
ncbi:hypothetical protein BH23CHL8_BH23CHL8_32280 [soil metagenome]